MTLNVQIYSLNILLNWTVIWDSLFIKMFVILKCISLKNKKRIILSSSKPKVSLWAVRLGFSKHYELSSQSVRKENATFFFVPLYFKIIDIHDHKFCNVLGSLGAMCTAIVLSVLWTQEPNRALTFSRVVWIQFFFLLD